MMIIDNQVLKIMWFHPGLKTNQAFYIRACTYAYASDLVEKWQLHQVQSLLTKKAQCRLVTPFYDKNYRSNVWGHLEMSLFSMETYMKCVAK